MVPHCFNKVWVWILFFFDIYIFFFFDIYFCKEKFMENFCVDMISTMILPTYLFIMLPLQNTKGFIYISLILLLKKTLWTELLCVWDVHRLWGFAAQWRHGHLHSPKGRAISPLLKVLFSDLDNKSTTFKPVLGI